VLRKLMKIRRKAIGRNGSSSAGLVSDVSDTPTEAKRSVPNPA
jgi:hypothetical protein